ncbi:MAG: TetR/AcrR family transcriptional regulator [Sphingomonadaceae bacterium]
MPETGLKETRALLEGAVKKMPRQGRSLASYERMLHATRELLLERGDDDFTLVDVSERGEVSIGSIYLRFDSKDRLLHAVIAQELVDTLDAEVAMHRKLADGSSSLEQFLGSFIADYSAFLGERATMLGLIMQKAASDPAISSPGKEVAGQSARLAKEGILRFRDEIRGNDLDLKATVVFQTVFSTIARQYGLGTTAESADPKLWAIVRHELAKMMLAYLRDAS